MARLKELYNKEIMPKMMKDFGYKNVMEVPKLQKIVINMGLGEAIQNIKILDSAVVELAAIAGQKPVITKAKKSIASFKLRHIPSPTRFPCRSLPAIVCFPSCRSASPSSTPSFPRTTAQAARRARQATRASA